MFCINCGGSLKEGAGFCIHCGAATRGAAPPSSPAPPAAAAPAAPVAAAAKTGSPLLKILLICVAVFCVLGAAGIIGTVYVAYRVKKSVTQAARNRGVDLSAFRQSSAYKGRLPDPCSLLTREEASAILDVTIERTQARGTTCDYYAQPLTQAQREEQIRKSMQAVQAHGQAREAAGAGAGSEDVNKMARESGMEALTKSLVAGANPGAGPYFTLELSENGKAQIAAMKLAMGAVAPGMKVSESLAAIGDEAELGPMDSILVFTKNGLGVQLDLRQIPNGRGRAIAMAQRILTRM